MKFPVCLASIFLLVCLPAAAALSVYMPPESLAARAELVLEGTVQATRSGFDPERGTLATYVVLDVDRVHRGPAGLSRVVVREAGGRVGDLVHEVDAVPVYREGSRVLTFLEPGRDGTLRTVGMFFGKFELEEAGALDAVRDLDGEGTILRRPAGRSERYAVADLVAVTHSVPVPVSRAMTAVPAEWERLVWEDGGDGRDLFEAHGDAGRLRVGEAAGPGQATARFEPISATEPSRWEETDSGLTLTVHVEPGADPLGDHAAAVAEIERAMAAWNEVPESRVRMATGNTSFSYTGTYGASPAVAYTGQNIILFDDPYDDIADPTNCAGVLAIGGYWRSGSTGRTVNGVTFYPAMQLYVIFNNAFECRLGDPDTLAEVAAHELGHGLGFGHSSEPGALMRAYAYMDGRGPQLGPDDIDAAHCHYPHELTLLSPNGGEVWEAGTVQSVTWSASAESGVDAGSVDLEYSTDGGSTWLPIVSGAANDGSYPWYVPTEPGTARVRVVRPHRGEGVGDDYPEHCSGDAGDAGFTISIDSIVAGGVGSTLAVSRVEDDVRLAWDPSCSAAADAYAVYSGSLAELRTGVFAPAPVTCAGGFAEHTFAAQTGSRYFLVTALADGVEGGAGAASGAVRPAPAACGEPQVAASCDAVGAGESSAPPPAEGPTDPLDVRRDAQRGR